MCVLLSDEFSISVVMTGVLSVGLGIVHYTQESVPSQVLHDLSVYLISLFLSLSLTQFKPMESEERLIQLLHRAIEAELEQGELRGANKI